MTDFDVGSQHPQGCGESLRAARERAGMSLQDVSQRLKMPSRVLQALEAGQWEQLGGAVFVRGQLRSYARLVGIDVEPFLQQAAIGPVQPAELVSHSYTPRFQHFFESAKRRAVYVVLTVVIVTPVWMGLRPQLGKSPANTTASLDVVPAETAGPAQTHGRPAATRSQATPYVASMAPIPRAAAPWLSLRFKGDSWVEVNAPDGRKVEHALIKSGEERRYARGEVGRVKLGDATAVEVQHAGSTVDLAPYQRANVARFAVSSEGSLAPVGD
ncbi:helix-turn-helix domain-containing protein [Pseudoxanthomonas putridarboris]|uniref:Helix-turn-helix domain-containing protein n=1 Tax=Pseudoxanthomonas putridarboris TaxID=752605 RepID=A0ABU9J1T3_9GAMM